MKMNDLVKYSLACIAFSLCTVGCVSTSSIPGSTTLATIVGGDSDTGTGMNNVNAGPFQGFPDIGFLLPNSPDFDGDEIAKLFYYADKTENLAGGAVEHGQEHYNLLVEKIGITVARMTLENKEDLLNELDNLSNREFNEEEKRLVEQALKELEISKKLASKALFAAGQLIYTSTQVPNEVENNPIKYGLKAPKYLKDTPGMLKDLKGIQENTSDYIELNGAVSKKLAEMANVEVPEPTSEEVETAGEGILGSEITIS